jgi:hypothetical protein
MNKRSIEFAALAIALTFAGACKGRTAAWEEKPSKTPSSAGATEAPRIASMEPGAPAWAARGQGKDKVLEAIAAWEVEFGCAPGPAHPSERCPQISTVTENAEMLALMTRAYYFTADAYLRSDEKAYLDTLSRAVWWGDRALLAASPEFAEQMRNKGKYHKVVHLIGIEGVPAMYWYATALGKWARASGFPVLLKHKDNIYATMSHVLELDPNYYHAGPYRYFGAYYAVAPGFAGGDTDTSLQNYEKSLELAPYFIGTKVLMAENLATKLDDEEMFDRLLQEVLDADLSAVPEEILPEMTVEKEKAKELMRLKVDEDMF